MRTHVGFTRLQGLTTLLSQQQQLLNEIVFDFVQKFKLLVLPNLAMRIKLTQILSFQGNMLLQ